MLTSRKLTTAAVRPAEDDTQQAAAAYESYFAAPGADGELGDPVDAQQLNDLAVNLANVIRAAGFNLRTEDSPSPFTNLPNIPSAARRDVVLLRAILALASGTAQTSLFGLTDTPANAAAGSVGDVLALLANGTFGFTTLSSQIRIAGQPGTDDRAPTTLDTPNTGRLWMYGGHTFIYRALEGSDHIWDVGGVWACGKISREGNVLANGIFAPSGYSGNGWARFSNIRKQANQSGLYDYQMRDTGSKDNYAVAVTPDMGTTPRPGSAFDDAESIGIWQPTGSSFSIAIGEDVGNRAHDAEHSVTVTRIGTAS